MRKKEKKAHRWKSSEFHHSQIQNSAVKQVYDGKTFPLPSSLKCQQKTHVIEKGTQFPVSFNHGLTKCRQREQQCYFFHFISTREIC